jgi:hypothetical protein
MKLTLRLSTALKMTSLRTGYEANSSYELGILGVNENFVKLRKVPYLNNSGFCNLFLFITAEPSGEYLFSLSEIFNSFLNPKPTLYKRSKN